MAKEWVRNANNRFDVESHSWLEVEKALRAVKEEKTQLAKKMKVSEHKHQSALAGQKNAETQVEDQHKLLYTIEVNLATEKATILSLKAELQKAKEVAEVAREAAKAAEEVAYEREM